MIHLPLIGFLFIVQPCQRNSPLFKREIFQGDRESGGRWSENWNAAAIKLVGLHIKLLSGIIIINNLFWVLALYRLHIFESSNMLKIISGQLFVDKMRLFIRTHIYLLGLS